MPRGDDFPHYVLGVDAPSDVYCYHQRPLSRENKPQLAQASATAHALLKEPGIFYIFIAMGRRATWDSFVVAWLVIYRKHAL